MDMKKLTDAVMHRWTERLVHDEDFNGLSAYSSKIKTILDVGANLGQSIVSFRLLFPDAKIHSFEANPALIDNLTEISRSLPGDIEIHPFGLGDCDGDFTLNIPYANGNAFIEEASISEDYYKSPWVMDKFNERGGLTLEKVICKIKSGDSLNLSPDLIKVDVEGAEYRVLLGLIKTIKRSKPIIIAENSDWSNVTKLLRWNGYAPHQYDKQTNQYIPQNGPIANTIYIHKGFLTAMTRHIVKRIKKRLNGEP